MTDLDSRKQLAKAMGWKFRPNTWTNPDGKEFPLILENDLPFHPFTDANDDYAVLEWMRTEYGDKFNDHDHAIWNRFCDEIADLIWRDKWQESCTATVRLRACVGYKIGMYAQAALVCGACPTETDDGA